MKNPSLFNLFTPLLHPAIRPITLGVFVFVALNVFFTVAVTFSPLNSKFNFSYGNFLPTKLALLKAQSAQPASQQPQVLFLGTSQTNNGFIPKVFEQASNGHLRSFNLGLPNNRYDIMLAYLQFHQKRFGKPRLVLIELSPSIQEKDASLYFLPALYYRTLIEQAPSLTTTYLKNPLLADNVKKELLLSGVSSLRQYRYTFSPVNVVRKVSEKANGLTDKLGGKFNPAAPQDLADAGETASADTTEIFTEDSTSEYDPSWMDQGWYPKPQSPHMTTPDGIALSVREARKYYIEQQPAVYFDKLQALLSYCKREEIPVALVSWPNHPAFLEAFEHSPLHQNYEQGLQALLAKNPIPLINLNDDLPASQGKTQGGLFADPRHLTPEGALYFSRKLAQRLLMLDGMEAVLMDKKKFTPIENMATGKQAQPTAEAVSCLASGPKSACL